MWANNIFLAHEPNRNAVNSIYDSMTDKEKIWLAGSVNDSDVPAEYVSEEEYGPKSALVYTCILYSSNGTAIAFCDAWLNLFGKADISIGTRSGCRGRGYATKVIQETIAWFRQANGVTTLSYYAHTDNASSIALAKRLGFQIFFEDDQVMGLEIRKI